MRLPVPEFKVLLYGPGLPAAGIKARAHFEESVLVAQGKGHWFTIQGDRLSLKMGGFDGRQWLLSWYTPSGMVTAILQGDGALEAFIKLAPSEISAQLKQVHWAHGGRARMFRLIKVLLAFFALLSVIVFGAFWIFAAEASHWAANRLTQVQRDQLGDMAFEQLRPSLKLVERGEVRETVEFIGVRVTTGSRNRYVFHVAESPQIKAIALPGGHVVVYTGLLRATQNSNELAAVLAHAVSHVEKRHTLSNIIRNLGWRAALAAVSGDLSSNVWRNMAAELNEMRFSSEVEQEADSESLIILRRAGVSADGLIPFIERMAKNEATVLGAEKTGIGALHPASQARVDALRENLANQADYQTQALPVDWKQFKRALSRISVQ